MRYVGGGAGTVWGAAGSLCALGPAVLPVAVVRWVCPFRWCRGFGLCVLLVCRGIPGSFGEPHVVAVVSLSMEQFYLPLQLCPCSTDATYGDLCSGGTTCLAKLGQAFARI